MATPLRWREMRGEKTPLKGVVGSFIADRHDLAERTRQNYEWLLGKFSQWCEGELGRVPVVGDVEPGTVNAYLSWRKTAGSDHLADAAWRALRSLAKFLSERRIHHTNGESVLRQVKRPKVKDDGRRALTDDEMFRVIERSSHGEQGPRDRALVWTLLGTGLRIAEACGLSLSDIDFAQRCMYIRASTSKSVHAREVTLPVEVQKELDLYINDHRKGSASPDSPLFTNAHGDRLTPDAARGIFDRLKVRTGIRDLCAHMLRHTWATNYHRSRTGSVSDLQTEGGWTTSRMLNRYVKRRPIEERRKAPSPFSASREAISGRRTAGRRAPQQGDGPWVPQVA